MTRRTIILWALGAGQLLAATFALVAFESTTSEWLMAMSVAIIYVQPYFIGIWIGFGRRSLLWRILAVALCLTGLTWLDSLSLDGVAWVLSPGIAVTLAIMLLARAFGFHLYDTYADSHLTEEAKYQFSLRSLLKWTTSVALLCSLASLANLAGIEELASDLPLVIVFHAVLSVVAFTEFIILLGMRRPWFGLVWFMPIALALIALFLWFGIGFITWFAICVLPLRLLGYRFGRNHPPTSNPSASPPPDCPFHISPNLAD